MQLTEYHISGRRSGKTTLTLEWMKESPDRVMVTHSVQAAESAWRRADEMGLNMSRDRFIPFQEVKNGALRGKACEIAIDNVEFLLSEYFAGTPIGRITATGVDTLR